MQTRRIVVQLAWLVPLCFYSADALAWGLATHIYFAQLLIWAAPLADPRFRRAAWRLPHLVMAGACLPDLALVGGAAFSRSHHWETCQRLLGSANTDEERAAALGYASHLLVDIVAHNHFVPAHEAMWLDWPMVTHVMGEWAMDSHINPQLFAQAGPLLQASRPFLAAFAAAQFDCPVDRAERALTRLAAADIALRRSRLPQGLYRLFTLVDRRVKPHFDYYVGQTAARVGQINSLLAGETPALSAEPAWGTEMWKDVQSQSLSHLMERLPLPHSFFGIDGLFHHMQNESVAMAAPISAPANTSVG